jgi:hypothetical protein
MIESGVVIDMQGLPAYWHLPPGRTGGSLPDSGNLWNFMWENRGHILGFAHSHPGDGVPAPSPEDVTTFSAVERALGRQLWWWITSSECVALYTWVGPGKYDYDGDRLVETPFWTPELRDYSNYYNKENGT